jgi:hypothetical protein
LEFAANVGGVFGAEVGGGGAVAIGSLDDYSLIRLIDDERGGIVEYKR